MIATGVVTTLAGSGVAGAADGTGTAATFNRPYGITTDGTNLYVADTGNNKIRQIVIATGVVSSLTGAANTADGSRCGGRRGHGGHVQQSLRHHQRRQQPVCGGYVVTTKSARS